MASKSTEDRIRNAYVDMHREMLHPIGKPYWVIRCPKCGHEFDPRSKVSCPKCRYDFREKL